MKIDDQRMQTIQRLHDASTNHVERDALRAALTAMEQTLPRYEQMRKALIAAGQALAVDVRKPRDPQERIIDAFKIIDAALADGTGE
jgi:hypothetical protein